MRLSSRLAGQQKEIISKLNKGWKDQVYKAALVWLGNHFQLHPNSGMERVISFKEWKDYLRVEFEWHYLETVFTFMPAAVDQQDVSDAGLQWLRCKSVCSLHQCFFFFLSNAHVPLQGLGSKL